ncbi:P43 5S RNA-binding protein [Thalassophryne amazonica]|uniref:P43 5S RNA-binding protein n=1 Tax=Thalassophryne amazonica TaxID=390379 RepID=UPI0014717622|nr:P43 5S RNA-binding protein [Thalassophryne amazonica]
MNCDGGPPLQLFNCTHGDCGATFTRQWKLEEHETVHTGARPYQCLFAGCGRSFPRRSHVKRHELKHSGDKKLTCEFPACTKTFFDATKRKRHVSYAHEDKKPFKCTQPDCSMIFKKRRMFKLHLKEHEVPVEFKCLKDGCGATFDSRAARKAHEKKHTGYSCPLADCQVSEYTWSNLKKHTGKHTGSFPCPVCNKVYKKAAALQRHKRSHASVKPVLACPRGDCQAYFSTTFNLEHHIRKVHLQLLKYKCSFADCPRMFVMRESLTRHLLHHDPNAATLKKHVRLRKSWQKRLNSHNQPLVEDNLRRLFTTRMRISRRSKVEANLSGLFNERKIPHDVDPEVNLRTLFKPPPLVTS